MGKQIKNVLPSYDCFFIPNEYIINTERYLTKAISANRPYMNVS